MLLLSPYTCNCSFQHPLTILLIKCILAGWRIWNMIRSNIKQNLNLRSLKNANLQHTQLTLLRSSGFSASSSPLLGLLRKAPDIAQILCRSFTPKRHRQLRVKDLPKVPTSKHVLRKIYHCTFWTKISLFMHKNFRWRFLGTQICKWPFSGVFAPNFLLLHTSKNK